MWTVLAGMEYVAKERIRDPFTPMVVNMSIQGIRNPLLNQASNLLVQLRIVVVVCAGNGRTAASLISPASASQVITVGGTTILDQRWFRSNYGAQVDLLAPAESIQSAGHWRDNVTSVRSGTSMASPAAAGVAAMYLQNHPLWSPDRVWRAMRRDSQKRVLDLLPGSSPLAYLTPNRLLIVPMD